MNDQQLSHLAVLSALNKMMRSTHFNICTVDAAVQALHTVPDARAYSILRPLHCVNWSDMAPELYAAVPQLIERCINVPAHQFQLTLTTPEGQLRVQAGTLRLLAGGGR